MKYITILFLIFMSLAINSETAFTKSGKKVILNDDFTWQYAPNAKPSNSNSNLRNLKKTPDQTGTLRSKYDKYDISYNPKNWESVKASNDSAEFGFENNRKSSYSMVIYEGLEIPMDSFPDIVLANAKDVDPNAYIIDIEEVAVNGYAGKIVKYRASSKGLNFVFYNFLTSGKFGSIQFIAFTLESTFESEVEGFDALISGLHIKDKEI
ncbi:MAG: DUF3157 family protein [Leptospira sp.]|nr:DUF3157 family protein [Leptospira sp.]